MTSDFVFRYLRDARQAYQLCVGGLGLSDPTDLCSLLRAARDHRVERKGQITTKEGLGYTYHIHGLGYTFKELHRQISISFDTVIIEGICRIRFSVWKLHQYTLSIGEPISEAALAAGLSELSVDNKSIVRVFEGPHEYYYHTGGG